MVIDKSEFIQKIKPLKAAISSKITSNAEGVLVKDDLIIADNFDYSIATHYQYSEKPFVLPKRAIELIESLPDGQIGISPSEKDVLVKSDAGTARFSTVAADAFFVSNPLTLTECEECSFSAATLCDMLSRVSYACAHDNSVHSGVLIEADGETLSVVAMDGYRLTVARTKQNSTFRAIVPATAVTKLISLGLSGNISIKATKNTLCICTEDNIISTKMLKGNFVDYRNALPKNHTAILEVNREDLTDVITRALICSNNGTEKAPVVFEFGSYELKVHSMSTVASYESEVSAKLIEGTDNIKIGLNGKFVLDALKSYAEETIRLEYNGTLLPLVIKGAALTSVIMPVKIK